MVAAEPLTLEQEREALRRALESHTFARSEQLRSFLSYICEAKFRGASNQLTEYVIGVEVLHRPENYSPAEDSVVRTRAYELRQKLEKLYASELSGDATQILIPKGAYIPQFVRSGPDSGVSASDIKPHPQVSAPHTTPPAPSARPWVFVLAIFIAALIGGAVSLWIQARLRPGAKVDPLLAEAWAPFAKPHNDVLLVAATPLYLVLGPATHGAYGSPIYPAPPEAYPLFRQQRPLAAGARLGMIFTKDALGVGSMSAVVTVSSTLHALGASSEILPERPAMMSLLRDRDTVLFGAPVDSQVISEILASMPLSVAYDESVREFVIRDRSNGRTLVPDKDVNGDFRTVYGLVTVLNNRDSDHGRLGMIVFSGITSVGTAGAAEYFTSPQALRSLRGIMGAKGLSGFPPAYQVVVKCKFENMLLIGEEYQMCRIVNTNSAR